MRRFMAAPERHGPQLVTGSVGVHDGLGMAGRTKGSTEQVVLAGRRVFLALVCLVIAPIAGIWVGVKFPNPPGNGPGVWQVIFGGGVPAALALVAAALTRVRRPEAVCWVL